MRRFISLPKIVSIILLGLLLYLPVTQRFFWSDDWFFLNASRVSAPNEVMNFFSPVPSEQATPMYRPLSTQVFFGVFQTLFGLHPLPYFLFALTVAGAGWWLTTRLWTQLKISLAPALLFLVFSASHFPRLTYLSAFQEVLMYFFAMLVLVGKRPHVRALAFIAALLSKENAVVIPFLVLLVEQYTLPTISLRSFGKSLQKNALLFLILGGYLFFRFAIVDLQAVGAENYQFSFSPFRAIHTLIWYTLWSLGLPELIINYVNNASILPKFWADFPLWSKLILVSFLGMLAALILATVRWLSQHSTQWRAWKTMLLGSLWFIVGLLPILFLPDHKYVLGQSLALVGLCIMVSELLRTAPRFFQYSVLSLYLLSNLLSIAFLYESHYGKQRSAISQKVFTYLQQQYPESPGKIYFTNTGAAHSTAWGESKQIFQSLGEDRFFSVLYGKNQAPEVRYEDFTPRTELTGEWKELPANLFLSNGSPE